MKKHVQTNWCQRWCAWWRKSCWHKVLTVGVAIFLVLIGGMYGIAQWYIHSQNDKPVQLGASFIPQYAAFLGVDPQETYAALMDDVGVKHFRLVSYWNDVEPERGRYDFTNLDWQFRMAEERKATITLTLGLRQPRWPECHEPSWVNTTKPTGEWYPALYNYMQAVVKRYKNSPALANYQLENEYFLRGFGKCTDFSRQRLIDEYKLIKRLDPQRQIIVGRSNNALGFPVGQPTPDAFSISVYKRVWDANATKRYLEYPFPAWFYGFLAGTQQLIWHRDMGIAELQAEAWPPNAQTIPETPLAEQNKSIDAKRLADRFEFGRGTGMKRIDLWGAEYWYYRKQILRDPSLWNVARDEFRQ